MNDPVRDLMTRASGLGIPPDGYWRGYGSRLRSRLDEPRTSGSFIPLLVATSAAVVALAFVLLQERGETAPASIGPRATVTIPRPNPQPARVVASKPEPAAPATVAETGEEAKPAGPDPVYVLPVRSLAVDLTEYARPQITAPPPETPEAPRVAGGLQLTDFRLLRNGVEIGRGERLTAEDGGVVWFADPGGQRIALSATSQPGFREAGRASGNLMTFDLGDDRFHWVSSSAIVEGEATIWVAVDRIAPLPGTMPPLPDRLRWPSLWPGDRVRERMPHLHRQAPDRRMESGSSPGVPAIRFGSARSAAELKQGGSQ